MSLLNRLTELKARRAELVGLMETCLTERRKEDITDEQRDSLTKRFTDYDAEIKHIDDEISLIETTLRRQAQVQAVPDSLSPTASQLADRASEHLTEDLGYLRAAPRFGQLRAFQGPHAEERAYASGQWLRTILQGSETAHRWCRDRGMVFLRSAFDDREQRAQSGVTNTSGGYLIPDVLLNTIIDLRETFGVFRANSKIVPMSSDIVSMPRRTAGLTAYFTNENTSITQSNMTWDLVQLSAKKLAALVLWPSELGEDAIISLADTLAFEAGYQFALKEDQCGFIGDGTSTYGGIRGLTVKINDGNYASSLAVSASGNTSFGTLDLADFHAVTGTLSEFARPGAKWFVSAAGFANSMERLAYAGGGNTVDSIQGGTGLRFLGYPVVITQVMNSTLSAQTDTILIMFGDLMQAACMGDRRMVSIQISDQRYFDSDQIALRATERFDIVVANLGATTDGTWRTPMVALKTASS